MPADENIVGTFLLEEDYIGMRFDQALVKSNHFDSASRSKITYLIQEGYIKVDGKEVKPSFKLKDSVSVSFDIPAPKPSWLVPDEKVKLDVVYRDDDVLVINKPAGLVVHPGAGHEEGTLVHGLLALIGDSLKHVGHPLRPGIVHRLDKDTTGLMVVALNDHSYNHLIEQFQPPRTISREYLALTHSEPKTREERIDLPIARDSNNKTKMAVDKERGKEAVTNWIVQETFKYGVLLRLILETGRTHQIRVHLQAVGAEIIGDQVYGKSTPSHAEKKRGSVESMKRQALHASKLDFIHPRTHKQISFKCEIPDDMQKLIEDLR